MEDHLSIRMDSIIAKKKVVNNLREIFITITLCTNTYAVTGLLHCLYICVCVCVCEWIKEALTVNETQVQNEI